MTLHGDQMFSILILCCFLIWLHSVDRYTLWNQHETDDFLGHQLVLEVITTDLECESQYFLSHCREPHYCRQQDIKFLWTNENKSEHDVSYTSVIETFVKSWPEIKLPNLTFMACFINFINSWTCSNIFLEKLNLWS